MKVIAINGRIYEGNNLTVRDDEIYIDGKLVGDAKDAKDGILEVRIKGDAASVVSDASVTINGNVNGDVKAGNYVTCVNIFGNVRARNYVECQDVKGKCCAGNYISKK